MNSAIHHHPPKGILPKLTTLLAVRVTVLFAMDAPIFRGSSICRQVERRSWSGIESGTLVFWNYSRRHTQIERRYLPIKSLLGQLLHILSTRRWRSLYPKRWSRKRGENSMLCRPTLATVEITLFTNFFPVFTEESFGYFDCWLIDWSIVCVENQSCRSSEWEYGIPGGVNCFDERSLTWRGWAVGCDIKG